MTDLACGVIQISDNVIVLRYSIKKVIRISIKCSCLEIFDQQESFMIHMIDLFCRVIQISNNVIVLRYSNLTPLVVIPCLINIGSIKNFIH